MVYKYIGDTVNITVKFKNTTDFARTFTVIGELFQSFKTAIDSSGASLLPGSETTVTVAPKIPDTFVGGFADVNAYLQDYDTGIELDRENNPLAVYIKTLNTMSIYYPSWAYNDVNINFDVTDSISTVIPPTIPPEQSSSANAPSLYLFTPTISGYDVSINGVTIPISGRTVTRINWDWGDGVVHDSWFLGTHTYSSVGYFIVTVTTYDNVGDWRKKSLRILIVTDKTPLQNVEVKCINTGAIKYTNAKGRATFSPLTVAGNYDFRFSLVDYKTETKTMNIQTRTLPPDEDGMSQPISRSISFGYFDPPVPFSDTDQQKMDAPTISSRYVPFTNFPDQYEMVKAYINFSGNFSISSDLPIRFRWYNFDTGSLLFTWQWSCPAGSWSGFWCKVWIGRCSWEIDRVGTYKLVIDFPIPQSGFSGSYGLYFIVR